MYVYTSCDANEMSSNWGSDGGGKFTLDQFKKFDEDKVEWDYWYWKKYISKQYENSYAEGTQY